MPAEPWKDVWLCWSPTGLDLSTSRKSLQVEQPPPLAAWVTALYKALVHWSGRGDASTTERMKSCSRASCVPMALGTADVRASTPCEAQQRAAPVFAGRQSDEDEDKRTGLERTCPPNTDCVYEYIAVVIRCGDGFYADWPDIKMSGGWAETMEELKQILKEILSCYFEEVVRGNFPVPPARFKTLDDYEEVEGEPMPDEDRESFLCLLPCRITFEETRAWMARKRVVSHTHYM